ncbi:acyltransferase family protein [Salipiger mangrovisoli]|uniref:Acyltransferase n=1 Tax=Salipiger mangrovisoli TaxID=2865933 RepID=A0ABR9WXL7_9RHOB|nr:acyltransferase family protein [Salipiger mangrovisoli]MBE9636044.1 acyltransferase [Salipiger mangrovisoli]
MPELAHAPMPYRPDIDGLRAIAVLSVVLYHFGLPWLGGGFTGVDVFFVISGFLIGGILWREYDAEGRIRLGAFYLRRFRRLAPAFFTMALATAALSAALLLPFEFREFGKSLIAATVYLSNVLFFRQAGYFDSGAETKPLLHTWSLAVEEQFYIFLPLLILALARNRTVLLMALVTIWAASLGASILATPSQPGAAFYLFPFRAWELLTGVLLAIWGLETGRVWRGHPALSWAGLALVLGAALLIPAGPMFPGVLALAPVLGAVLLIASGTGDSPVNRALSHPAALFFGRISYSLYLWHWPVVTLSLYLRGAYSSPLEASCWMALAVALAWLSWRYVEMPMRRARLSGVVLLTGTALASGATLALGAWLYLGDGLADRFDASVRPHIAASADFLQDWSRCTTPASGPLMGIETCPIGPEGTPQVLVWGDSHVRAFKEGLDLAAQDAGVPALIIWRAGCPPLFGLRKTESAAKPAQDRACAQANLQIRQALPELPELQRIALIGRWTYYAQGSGIGLDAGNTITLFPADAPTPAEAPQSHILAEAVRTTVAELRREVPQVIALRQPPEIPLYDSRVAAREAAHAGWPLAPHPVTDPDVPISALAQRVAEAEAPWRALAARDEIAFIDSWPRFCDAETCHALQDGAGWYFDNNHVTNTAALGLRDLFAPVFGTRVAGL